MVALTLVVDRDLQEWLPAVDDFTDAELERSIIKSNGPLDPIRYWPHEGQNLIVDGHRRYGICVRHNLPFKAEALEFKDREAAKEWMDSYQLSRRNLSERQRAVVFQRMMDRYEARGMSRGEAVKKIAESAGITTRTVHRSLAFNSAFNSLPEDLQKVIDDETVKASEKDVITLAGMNELHQRNIVRQVRSGEFKSLHQALHGTVRKEKPAAQAKRPVQDDEEDDTVSQAVERAFAAPPKPAKEEKEPDVRHLRSAAVKYAEALQRAIDDLNVASPNKMAHSRAAGYAMQLLGVVKGWM
jgi:hypothetical protein